VDPSATPWRVLEDPAGETRGLEDGAAAASDRAVHVPRSAIVAGGAALLLAIGAFVLAFGSGSGGAVAVEGGKWELYIGGAAGAHVRKGDLLCTVDSHEQVLLISGRFIQYYRENAKYLERTYGFVERVGVAKIRQVVVEDSEGIAARLDEALQNSVDAYRDPWLEATTPATANQFASHLPIVQ